MPSWEQFKAEADARAAEIRAEVEQKIKDIETYYKEQFAKAQEAAISERSDDVGPGETTEEYRARIAAVPGSFSDRAQSAIEVVTTPKLQAAAVRPSTPATPVVTPVAEEPAPEPQPEQPVPEPVDSPIPNPTPEPTPAPEPTPEPEPVVEPEPQVETPAEAPEETAPAA